MLLMVSLAVVLIGVYATTLQTDAVLSGSCLWPTFEVAFEVHFRSFNTGL